jgi:WXG100 family type VII secretion target
MPPAKIRADYAALDKIANDFNSSHNNIQSRLSRIISMRDRLEAGFVGEAASAFFAELNDEVIPRVVALIDTLDNGAESIRTISTTLHDAEETAGNFFK